MIRRILLGGVLVLCPTAVWAQDSPALVEYYGDGVHAFSSGNIFESHRLLTEAIDGGIQDPRAYYFRAMTLLRMGRHLEAEADMEAGAYLEARAPSGAYAVDRSIQRLQGRDRLALEKIRRRVRFEAEQERRAEMRLRYEQTQRNEGEILRSEPRPTYDEAVQSAAGITDSPGEAATAGAPATNVAPATDATAPGQDTAPAPETPPADAADAADPSAVEPAEGAGGDPFSRNGNSFSETPDAPDAAAIGDPAAEVEVEVGQKIKGPKLLGILGSIFGDVVESAIPQPPTGAGMPFGGGAGPAEGEPFGADDPFGGVEPLTEEEFERLKAGSGENDSLGGASPSDGQSTPPAGGDNPFEGLGQPSDPTPANENASGAEAAPPADDNNPFGGIESDAPSDSTNPFGTAEDPFNG